MELMKVRGMVLFITPALEMWCVILIIVLRIMDFR